MPLQGRSWGSGGNLTAVAFACGLSKGHSSADSNGAVMISYTCCGGGMKYPQAMTCESDKRSRNFVM